MKVGRPKKTCKARCVCWGRFVELLYTQILVAIVVSMLFSIYNSQKATGPPNSTVETQQHAPPNPTSRTAARAEQQKRRQEALQRLAQEAAGFEDEDQKEADENNHEKQEDIDNNDDHPGLKLQGRENEDYGRPRDGGAVSEAEDLLVQPSDFIYQKLPGESAPIVLENYKLIFFTVPKVGCTVWKMLFRRILGFENWQEHSSYLPHAPEKNGLAYLYHYNRTYASQIMLAPDWTRAIFLRDPKERFLSAYLDKAVMSPLFWDTCCNRFREIYCNPEPPKMYEFLDAIETCRDSHWDPQSTRMEEKYWPYINFVGKLDTVHDDSKRLLEHIGAWEEFGQTGWGESKASSIFGGGDGLRHSNNAKDKVMDFMYPELELAVENFYEVDYSNPMMNFTHSVAFQEAAKKPAVYVDHETLELPIVEPRDWIYREPDHEGESSPIVVEKYNLVFFPIPQVARIEFKRLFLRMMGRSDWKTKTYNKKYPNTMNEGLVFLHDFNLTRASEIMTSPNWTRALFVRDPKERFVLTYAETAVRDRVLLHDICCHKLPRRFCIEGSSRKDIIDSVPNITEFLKGTAVCKDSHWDPITERLGALTRLNVNPIQKKSVQEHSFLANKYWKYIDFVGHLDRAYEDAKAMLERIGAWEEHGQSGWGDGVGEGGHDSFFNTESFLSDEKKIKERMQQYIRDPKYEELVERFYESDYDNPYLKLTKKSVFFQNVDIAPTEKPDDTIQRQW